jgi:hypothetical protein
MTSLSAIPGYDDLKAQADAAKAQADTFGAQRAAAIEAGNTDAASSYSQQENQAVNQYLILNNQLQKLILDSENTDLASPTSTTGQNQSTPAPNPRDDGPTQASNSGGVGAGTSSNSFDSRGNDNNPGASKSSTQQMINQSFANQPIVPQPNVLDQYDSYTYAISWWVLTPDQYNTLTSGLAPAPGTGNWSLLMQSGGAPIAGRNQFFPLDYYLDDLEIETFLMGKGTSMSTNGMEIKFKVVEPNGLTLIQNLYSAVVAAYKPTGKTTQVPNYAAAQYCLTIEFYGYDSNGKLVAPATGQYTTNGQLSNANASAVIKKYYPFLIETLTFRTVANQIEYNIVGKAVPYATGAAQARGTIPFAFQLAGQTVLQLLQGGPLPATASAPSVASEGRVSAPTLPSAPQRVSDLTTQQQGAIAAGTDPSAVTDSGMAFGGGGLSG